MFFLPLLVATAVINGTIASLSARSGMTRIAVKLLSFKTNELRKYAEGQWQLLVTSGLSDRRTYLDAAKSAVGSYASTVAETDTELILAVDLEGRLVMSSSQIDITGRETTRLQALTAEADTEWVDLEIGGRRRVGYMFSFAPFGWIVLVTEDQAAFYREVQEIMVNSVATVLLSSIAALVLAIAFSHYMTRPLDAVVRGLQDISRNRDFSQKVEVVYADEVGRVAHQFNIMTHELETAYNQVKEYALQEMTARRQVSAREYETLRVLGRSAEYRDPETGAHIVRVGLYSRLIAQALGEDEASQELIYYASPLHDIGKLGIPDSILLKPGRLTKEEFDVMKTHTRIAYDILKEADSGFLRAGAVIALSHHERYDGGGYPNGLSGQEIPLYGRIVGLVDVFDALTSNRPYKEAWPLEKAVDLLISGKGTQFDPDVAEQFVTNLEEVVRIHNSHREE
jgi:response regulator RpfG family c-di-GMP phosphodiesterase